MYSSGESCSPERRRLSRSGTGGGVKSCFSYQSLARIARRFNAANPTNPITISRNRDDLWHAIRKRIPECKDERCWIQSRWITDGDRTVIEEDFKPPIPQGKYAWLNSDDIDRVLYQYEKIVPGFRFLGTHPIDFQTVIPEVWSMLKQFLRSSKVKKIGLVLNLDYHDEPGSHWVAVLIDKQTKTGEYFDSFGDDAPREVYELFDRIGGVQVLINKVAHQRKNSECGNYAINFIVQRISGSTFKQVTSNVIRDEQMNSNRKIFFDPHHSYKN
jgi:hypothetical protein